MIDAARPRVAVLGHTSALSGAELALARLLGNVDKSQWDVVVVLFADGPLVGRIRALGIPVQLELLDPTVASASRHRLGRMSALLALPRLILFTFRLARTLRRLNCDLVHANSLKAGLIGVVSARLARVRIVWYVHDRISKDYLPGPVAAVMRQLIRFGATSVLVNSRATLETLRLAPSARVAIAYPGVDPAAFDVRRAPDSPPRVGIIGRVSPTKGQDVFLRAAAVVHSACPDAQFVIIGGSLFDEADYEHDLHALVAELGLDDVVTFAGQVPDVDVELGRLAVCVHASPVPEPFGQVIVEAMAAGVPVVATLGGGVVEITGTDELYALTVKPGSPTALAGAIERVLADPAAADTRAGRARDRVRDLFTIDRTVEVVQATWKAATCKNSTGR